MGKHLSVISIKYVRWVAVGFFCVVPYTKIVWFFFRSVVAFCRILNEKQTKKNEKLIKIALMKWKDQLKHHRSFAYTKATSKSLIATISQYIAYCHRLPIDSRWIIITCWKMGFLILLLLRFNLNQSMHRRENECITSMWMDISAISCVVLCCFCRREDKSIRWERCCR